MHSVYIFRHKVYVLAVNTLKTSAAASTEVTSLQQSRDDNNVSKIADIREKMYFVVFKAKFCGVYNRK